MIQTRQTFRVADKEISSFLQAIKKPVDQHALCPFIEINHNVPTKYYIKGELGRRLPHEIESREIHGIPQTFFHPIASCPATGPVVERVTRDASSAIGETESAYL